MALQTLGGSRLKTDGTWDRPETEREVFAKGAKPRGNLSIVKQMAWASFLLTEQDGASCNPRPQRAFMWISILIFLATYCAAAIGRISGSRLDRAVTVVLLSGTLSAFFVNDAICLVLTPLVVEAVSDFRLNPLPYHIPAVLVLEPVVARLPNPTHAWLTLATASTLAGNLTTVGSVANLIVVERARQYGVEIGFWDYFKVGAPLTLATILVGVWVLG